MNYQEALAFIQSTLAPRQLSYIEELVFRYSWDGKRYREMAQATGYEEGYLLSQGYGVSSLASAIGESGVPGYQKTPAFFIAFNPDSTLFAVTSRNDDLNTWQIDLWRTEGTRINTLMGHQSEVRAIAFSSDGQQLLSGSFDKTFMAWNINPTINLDEVTFACDWLSNYLRTNVDVDGRDSTLCDLP